MCIRDRFIISNNSLVRDLGIMNPRIAVLSLNPHNGDGGNIGKEELKVIMPAIEKLRNVGFNVSGPLAACLLYTSNLPVCAKQADS